MSAIGQEKIIKQIVTEEMLASNVRSGEARVLGTPVLIALCERCASELVSGFLAKEQSTVGIHVDFHHLAPTPLGMEVSCVAKITRISENGKIYTFSLQCFDAVGEIANGTHKRAVVNLERFQQRADQKNSADAK